MDTQKLILKQLVVILAISFFMFSCKKDKGTSVKPATSEVAIEITSPKAATTAWNTISIDVKAVDADAVIKYVELYANDILVGTKESAPFQFDWNTKEVEDGEVKLKAVALSETDEELASNELSINVMNTLIHYKIAQNTIPFNPEAKHFTFITNEKREVLYFKQIEELPFEDVALRPDDFDGEKISVHLVEANPIAGKITSFNDVTPGQFNPLIYSELGEQTGSAKITLTDVPPHTYFTANNLYGEVLNENAQTLKYLYQNQHLLYVYLRNGDQGNYKIENNLVDGDNIVSLSSVSLGEMTLHNFAENGKIIDNFDFHVYGHIGTGPVSPSAMVYRKKLNSEFESLAFDFHIPTNESSFDHYSSYVRLFDGEKLYMQQDYFHILTGINKLAVNFSVEKRKLSEIDITASGSAFDILKTTYVEYGIDDFLFYWENYSKDDNISFPPIPADLTKAISGLSNANLGFVDGGVQMEATEYQYIDGYTDFINRYFGRDGVNFSEGASSWQNVTMEFPVN